MATQQWHRAQADVWLTTAETNYIEIAQDATVGARAAEDLGVQMRACLAAATIAQAHATLALGTETTDA